MAKKETAERITSDLFSKETLNLADKILKLEVDERIKDVKFGYAYSIATHKGLTIDIHLKTPFNNLDEFKKYLINHNLPSKPTYVDLGRYVLLKSEIKAYFYVPKEE